MSFAATSQSLIYVESVGLRYSFKTYSRDLWVECCLLLAETVEGGGWTVDWVSSRRSWSTRVPLYISKTAISERTDASLCNLLLPDLTEVHTQSSQGVSFFQQFRVGGMKPCYEERPVRFRGRLHAYEMPPHLPVTYSPCSLSRPTVSQPRVIGEGLTDFHHNSTSVCG